MADDVGGEVRRKPGRVCLGPALAHRFSVSTGDNLREFPSNRVTESKHAVNRHLQITKNLKRNWRNDLVQEEKTTGQLVKESLDHVREILRSEVRLARAEVREEARMAGQAAGIAAGAALFAALGVNFLLWAVLWALAPEVTNWLASSIVGVASLVIAGLAAAAAYARFRQIRPPERTEETIKENIEWAKKRA